MDHYTPFSPKDSTLPPEEPPFEPPKDTEEAVQTPAEEQQERLDYVKSIVSPRKPTRTWLRLVVVLVLLGVLLGAGGYVLSKHNKAKTPAKKASSGTSQVAPSGSTSTTTTHYVSNGSDLNLSFDYPNNWTATPASGTNTSDQTITLNSPLVTIINSAGASTTGKVTFTIRPGTATLNELSSGQATTAQASVQIAYSKPTSAQYQYPYVTFIHLKGGANPTAAFEEVLVSGTTQFSAGQGITDTSVAADPIITASFYSCATAACSGAAETPLSITNDTWLNNTVFQQTLTLIESLQLN